MRHSRETGKTVIIVQARMMSTRLPGKVLKEVMGKPLLEYLIERLRRVSLADDFVIATTVNNADDAIVALANRLRTSVFRGDEQDVLGRYYHAAVVQQADTVVRVTSDCPLLDPAVVDEVIGRYRKRPQTVLVHNSPGDDAKRTYPRGMDVEVFSAALLAEAHILATTPDEREHVTAWFRKYPGRFPEVLVDYHEYRGRHRLCVDTQEDFALMEKLLRELYPRDPRFTIRDIFRVLDDNPTWSEVNAAIRQKTL